MSIAAVQQFLDRVRSDKEVTKSLEPYKDAPYEEKLSLGVKRAGELGYNFTVAEFRESDQLKHFWKSVLDDPKLQDELKKLESQSPQEIVANTVKIAEKHGYKFSAETMNQATQLEMSRNASGELSEADLEVATGGAVAQSFDKTASVVGLMANVSRPGGFNRRDTIMCPDW